MTRFFKYTRFFSFKALAVSLPFFLLFSCSNDEKGGVSASENVVSAVSVEFVKPVSSDFTRAEDGDEELVEYPGDVDPLIINSFDTNSLLYISQMGTSESTNPNFDVNSTTGSYCYVYQYYENEEADWDNEYNFKTLLTRNAIDWNTVRSLGSVGNAFSFFSFYFPVENQVTFNVLNDQRGAEPDLYATENFERSDIMGAYHATSSLFSRLRFRLFHLMVYLKVTIYVPVYEATDNDGDYNYSGYDEGAFVGAYVLNASTGISIEWRANRSSDIDPPLTQPTSTKSNITMYGHTPDTEEIELTNLKDYYASSQLDSDMVRAYNFSVLFPGQVFNGDFLCFVLKDAENHYRYYYFNSNQVIGSTGDLALTQGTLQQLYLYLPRKTNETILIGANILPWSNGLTDMTVSKENTGTIDDEFMD